MDHFKKDFKYYKSRVSTPIFDKVIDFDKIYEKHNINPLNIDSSLLNSPLNSKYGLKPSMEWKAFQICDKKGLIFIRNPFYGIGQRYWISRCLKDYTRKPNKLNLDAHGDLNNCTEWWEASNSVKKDLKKKLRWATLGYHHDWDTKVYNENDVTEFPQDLAELCKIIATTIGFEGYLPQASIVNYYHMDSTLAPHTDHSEKYLDAPLISISFGQSAVFLIGGETKEEKPLAMFLHSGDIVIMSKESRLCYHAVPRIIKTSNCPWNDVNKDSEFVHLPSLYDTSTWKLCEDYVLDSRININVRQVLNPVLSCNSNNDNR